MPVFQLPKRRRIFLMRHGDVTYFDDSGRAIDPETVPLNANGREQASAAGRAFAAQQIRFDRVIVSGLPRTVETAQRVLAETGQQIELDIEPALQEIRGGKLSNIPPQDIEAAFLGAFDGIVPESTRFLDGETIGELFDRVLPAVSALREDTSWDSVLLVLHGGVNRAILSHALTAGGRTFWSSGAGHRLHQRARRRRRATRLGATHNQLFTAVAASSRRSQYHDGNALRTIHSIPA